MFDKKLMSLDFIEIEKKKLNKEKKKFWRFIQDLSPNSEINSGKKELLKHNRKG